MVKVLSLAKVVSFQALTLSLLCLLLGAAAHIPPLELQFDTLAAQPALLSLG